MNGSPIETLNELGAEVSALNGELATARTHLSAYEGHLVEMCRNLLRPPTEAKP